MAGVTKNNPVPRISNEKKPNAFLHAVGNRTP